MTPGYAQDIPVVIKVEFSTLTRGAHETILITKDCVKVGKQRSEDREEKKSDFKITAESWNSLMNEVNRIPLPDVATLQSPTKDRAFDGAYHSSIIITTDKQETFTHTFDNENPHQKLVPLMLAIRKLVPK
jgi:hypothetical protein